jgi:hypothetical protein
MSMRLGGGLSGIFPKFLLAGAAILATLTGWAAWPRLNWTDRRPIGSLFLADYSHRSLTNPRGWFNAPALDFVGTGGRERFQQTLQRYADRAIEVMKAVNSQGMIVWDLEGEEFPQKISYIGDPRLVEKLAPEMAPAIDDFFARFRNSGFRIGMTIRPQELVFPVSGALRQENVWNSGELLLQKIDYARQRWGANLFYIDSTRGILSPREMFNLSWVARRRPEVLLIPEHNQPLYYGFSAPYAALRSNGSATSAAVHLFSPHAFEVLNISDALGRRGDMATAYRNGDILLFSGWYWSKEADLVKSIVLP